MKKEDIELSSYAIPKGVVHEIKTFDATMESFCAEHPVPTYGRDRRALEIARIAQRTNSPHFDRVAEEITRERDKRLIRVEKDGHYDYYYRWKTPLTKFRGFWGTLIISYWPMVVFSLMVQLGARQLGIPHTSFWDKVVKGGSMYTLSALVYAFGIIFCFFWNRALTKAGERYFFLEHMTNGRTRYAPYAHKLYMIMVWLHILWLVIACLLIYKQDLKGFPTDFGGYVSGFVAAMQMLPEYVVGCIRIAPEVFWHEPTVILKSLLAGFTLSIGLLNATGYWYWGVVCFSIAGFYEFRTRNFTNLGVYPIYKVVCIMDDMGILVGGLRKQAVARLSYAQRAGVALGGLMVMAFGMLILAILALVFLRSITLGW